MQRVIVLSEDRDLKDALKLSLPPSRYRTDEFRDKGAFLDQVGASDYPLAVLDGRTVGGDMDLISSLRQQDWNRRILWLTPAEAMGGAAEAIRRGADFYLTLPLREADLKQVVAEWEREADVGQFHWAPKSEFPDTETEWVGQSAGLKHVFALAARVAPTDSPVLITGETGVGKELVARSIHRLSERANRTFVAVNCGAIPETLLESELFGFKKGAFTGATSDRPGLFQQANGGTFFLDEVGELSPNLQVKLLRVLEDGHLRPLGSGDEQQVNVRVLAATNRDLSEEVRLGHFRSDLFYRLHVINIHVPPLRERREDLPPLIKFFLEKYNRRFNKSVISINRDALYALMHYDYPGNVRELENFVQHGVLLAEHNIITKTSLPPQIFQRAQLALEGSRRDQPVSIERAEEELIKAALTKYSGNQTEASKSLGISRSTLWRKIKTYNLEHFK